jgi:hypothetical protein
MNRIRWGSLQTRDALCGVAVVIVPVDRSMVNLQGSAVNRFAAALFHCLTRLRHDGKPFKLHVDGETFSVSADERKRLDPKAAVLWAERPFDVVKAPAGATPITRSAAVQQRQRLRTVAPERVPARHRFALARTEPIGDDLCIPHGSLRPRRGSRVSNG